jgi:hypothetical protein
VSGVPDRQNGNRGCHFTWAKQQAAFPPWIDTDLIVTTTGSVALCERMKSWLRFLNWKEVTRNEDYRNQTAR